MNLPENSSGYDDNWNDQMFGGLYDLTDLDMSGFRTSNVTNMGGMFSGCSSLTNLDMSSFDLSNAKAIWSAK